MYYEIYVAAKEREKAEKAQKLAQQKKAAGRKGGKASAKKS